jgi:hypothetical protein
MTAADVIPYVSFVMDTALSLDHNKSEIGSGTILVGWQCGFEPLFIAVLASYTRPDEEEAAEIATDYLIERQWFAEEATEPDYIIAV